MENKIDGKYLERIQIEGLWGRYDVDWYLHQDVNILMGENGTGKSTILLLAAAALAKPFLIQKRPTFDAATITVNSKEYRHKEWMIAFSLKGNQAGYTQYLLDGQKPEDINASYINTFEFITLTTDSAEDGTIKTNLDQQLDLVTRQYLDYQVRRANEVFSQKTTFDAAFTKKAYLFETLNRLFASTGKKVDEKSSELEFLIDGTERIQRQDLSSGEKQLLILLLTVLCQEEKPAIFIMDEPEISLHIRWQYELITILRTFNPNCQLIIATHSPSIFNDGWRDKVFWTEDIVQKAVPA